MRDATSKEAAIERVRSGEHKVGDGSDPAPIGRAEKSIAIEAEPASTMTLSFPLERSRNKP